MSRTGADIKTTIPMIVEYWSSRVYEGDMGCDWSEAHERCWRCGCQKSQNSLHRCHIIPRQDPFEGPDVPSNFVLLCKRCHEEAPSCSDPLEMWRWIKSTRAETYDIYWEQRAWQELKLYHGIDLEEELRARGKEAFVQIVGLYRSIFEQEIGMHLGKSPFSVASKAFVWRKVLSAVPRTPASLKHEQGNGGE